jgi:alkylation response protein AidB-like acyl-CoA dehydrogenase
VSLEPVAAAGRDARHHGRVDAEDSRQVRDAVRELVREVVVPLEERIEDEDRLPDELRARAADMGLFGYALPEEHGGLGVTMAEDVELAFEFGYITNAPIADLFVVFARSDPAERVGGASPASSSTRRRRGSPSARRTGRWVRPARGLPRSSSTTPGCPPTR